MNKDAMNFFKDMANDEHLTQNSVKMAKNSDFSEIDAEFILRYADENSDILDLGSGTGLIVNKIYNKVKRIVALEPFEQFTKYIVKAKNVEIVNKNILDFKTSEKFDLITLFGLMPYFSEDEAIKIYEKYFCSLKQQGKIIIKNQFGVNEDVTINNFSEELGKNYFSQYRYLQKEIKILDKIGFKDITSIDIYLPECNRWDNTHFFAIVAQV